MPDSTTSLSRIEAEAQELLLQRRQSLFRSPTPVPGDPSSHWRDWESIPEPLADEQKLELLAIEEALGRISQGRYGTCLACGGPLGLQRIRAIPEARYCLSCSGTASAAEG
jgi:RNA polymerase-binding transcription factor DksA